MGLFRRNKKKSKKPVETHRRVSQQSSAKQSNSANRLQSPNEELEGSSRTSESSGHFHRSDVHSKFTARTGDTLPPPSREAAFHGPPRFDWIDIETNAATKVQSIYRRNKVMTELEAKGLSTSAIRNRRRRRKAASRPYRSKVTQSEDAPSFFQCCAMGLAFGDATEEDDQAYRQFQKKQYEESKKQQAMHESALRKRYTKQHGHVASEQLIESFEVVD